MEAGKETCVGFDEGKATFAEICDSIGAAPSNAIRMFVSVFNKHGGFPFDLSNPYGFNAETHSAMNDASSGNNLPGPYENIDEMFAKLDKN